MWLLGFAFAAPGSLPAAMAVHLPRMLETAGATTAQAIAAGAMIGPAQVAARLLEAGFLSRFHALVTARLAAAAHPVGVGLLFVLGGTFPYGFALFPRGGQRDPDHRARHGAAGGFRPGKITATGWGCSAPRRGPGRPPRH